MSEEQPIIAGKPVAGSERLVVREPYSGRIVGEVTLANDTQIEQALEAGSRALSSTRALNSFTRARILKRIGERIREQRSTLAELIAREAGKPIKLARVEVERAITTFELSAEVAKSLTEEFLSLDVGSGSERRYGLVRWFPRGLVLAITPFNFPLNLIVHKVGPAIAVGAPFIIKPAPQAPFTALALGKILLESGYPPEAVSVIPCTNEQAERMVRDRRTKVLSFTGSSKVGWHLKQLAAEKQVVLECGGNAGVLVSHHISREMLPFAVQRCVLGGFSYAGQICISVQRIFVLPAQYEEFREKIAVQIAQLKGGDPLDPLVDFSSMISQQATEQAAQRIQEAVEGGARLLCGGGVKDGVLLPTLLENTTSEMAVERVEMFAPVVVLNRVDNFEQGLRRINEGEYGLQAGVFSSKVEEIFQAFEQLEVGSVVVNDIPTFRHDLMPYGGEKRSGFGREGPRYVVPEYATRRLLVLHFPA